MSSDVSWAPQVDSFDVRLVLVRHRMGWNVKEAALACGLPAQNWREWEAGRRPRDYEGVCKQIAARTMCDLIWLMAGPPSEWGTSVPVTAKPVGYVVSPARSLVVNALMSVAA